MFALFPDLVAAGESDESSNARLETLVQQLPPIHVASLRVMWQRGSFHPSGVSYVCGSI